jgi:hypothetical protein
VVELYVLFKHGIRISRLARCGGRSGPLWIAILVVLWFAGEAVGIAIGVGLAYALQMEGLILLLVYGLGLAGAICGLRWAFSILTRLIERDEKRAQAKAEPVVEFYPIPNLDD